MMKAIIGRKLQMTQLFSESGAAVPVTLIEAGPCTVTQVKTVDRDGYAALQIAFGMRKAKHVNRPLKGHMDKAGQGYFQVTSEVRLPENGDRQYELGQQLTVDSFKIGDVVDIRGTSKGKGYAGTIKRWGFGRGPSTHGSKNVREPGTTGNATFPGRVIKGRKMAGQKGNKRVTVMGLKVIDVRPEDNLLVVKGAVPGARNGIVFIRQTNRVR